MYRTRYGRRNGYGTRYSTTRRYTGYGRQTTRSMFTPRGRRFFGRGSRGSFKRNLRRLAEKKTANNILVLNPLGTSQPKYEGDIYPLTIISQGTTSITRVGDKVTGSSIEINYVIYPASPATVLGYFPSREFIVRIIIFIWKDDSAPTPADLIDYPPGSTISVPIYPLNHDKKVKRKVLYDKTHTLYADFTQVVASTGYYTGAINPIVTRRFAINLTKLRGGIDTINFIGSATANPINQIYMFIASNVPAVGAPLRSWPFELITRYNFVDV